MKKKMLLKNLKIMPLNLYLLFSNDNLMMGILILLFDWFDNEVFLIEHIISQ